MPDPDPSDFSDVAPVNRIALLTRFGLFEPVGFPNDSGAVGALGHVVNLDQPEGIKHIVPELARATRAEFDSPALSPAEVYHALYTFVKQELDGGSTEEEIRARTRPVIESEGGLADAVREAVEDALANRPMKSPDPFC